MRVVSVARPRFRSARDKPPERGTQNCSPRSKRGERHGVLGGRPSVAPSRDSGVNEMAGNLELPAVGVTTESNGAESRSDPANWPDSILV